MIRTTYNKIRTILLNFKIETLFFVGAKKLVSLFKHSTSLFHTSLLIIFFMASQFVLWFFVYIFGYLIIFLLNCIYFFIIVMPVLLIRITYDLSIISTYLQIFNDYLDEIDEIIIFYITEIVDLCLDLVDASVLIMLEQGLCVFGPLFASICSGVLSRYLNKDYVLKLTFFFFIISFLCVIDLLAFYINDSWEAPIYLFLPLNDDPFTGDNHTVTMFPWFDYGMEISFYLLFDSLSVIMVFIVLTVSALVHVYSIDYMENDPHFFRFFSYLSAFTFFMLLMVTASNFVQLFIGWEGIGVLSMLLINFWYTRIQANKAALKAVLVNRIGDIFLLIGMGFSFYFFKTLNFEVLLQMFYEQKENVLILFANIEFFNGHVTTLQFLGITLLIASLVKSAQIGFYIWLPDAMEGPTPVSALLHAATMVTAGVFLLLRFSFIFDQLGDLLYILSWCSMFTSLFAGLVALYQYDIKKIIAYSTCSQLAMMFAAISASQYTLGFFHLFTHAWFKALLFLTAGVIIHALGGEQDLRRMGGLLNVLPLAAFSMFVGTLAIIGIPMLSGFYSKENILFSILGREASVGIDFSILCFFFFLTSLLTAVYSFRLFILIFFRLPNGRKYDYFNLHRMQIFTMLVLSILIILSIFSGYFFSELFAGYGSQAVEISMPKTFLYANLVIPQFLPTTLKSYLFVVCIMLFFFCMYLYVYCYTCKITIISELFIYIIEYICLYLKYLNAKIRTKVFWLKIISDDSLCPLQKEIDAEKELVFTVKFDYTKFVEARTLLVDPIVVYIRYNAFLFNNFVNKLLYFIIEHGQITFSLILEREFFNFYVYYRELLNILLKFKIFLIKRFSLYFHLLQILLFIFVFVCIFLYSENFYVTLLNLVHENFFKDVKK